MRDRTGTRPTTGYVCPRSGIYLITGSIRVSDATAVGSTYSCGVLHPSRPTDPGTCGRRSARHRPSRATFAYSRLSYQSAGDKLRMFAYSDASGGVTIQAAGLQIALVSDAV